MGITTGSREVPGRKVLWQGTYISNNNNNNNNNNKFINTPNKCNNNDDDDDDDDDDNNNNVTSIYPITGASQGCENNHNIVHNISVELQTL